MIVLQTLYDMLAVQFHKMSQPKMLLQTAAVAIAFKIPGWVFHQGPTINHAVMIVVLVVVMCCDWLSGSVLAHRSPVMLHNSHYGNEAIIRDAIIVFICFGFMGMDFVLKSKSFLFAVFTAAFIAQNMNSVLSNVYVLGWNKYFPMWLFSLLKDEIISKVKKYYQKGEPEHEKE